jgi:Zn-dependent protease
MDFLLRLATALPAFVLGIVLHELGHAIMAERLGDTTAREHGRVTLDPRKHFDPMGALMFLFSMWAGFGFGWAKPVPVNTYRMRLADRRAAMALVSIAGPASNFLQLLAWAGLFHLYGLAVGGGGLGALSRADEGGLLALLLLEGMFVNAALMCFNLLPIPPLDGSRVLVWALPPGPAAFIESLEPIGFVILIVALWAGLLHFVGPLLEAIVGLFI